MQYSVKEVQSTIPEGLETSGGLSCIHAFNRPGWGAWNRNRIAPRVQRGERSSRQRAIAGTGCSKTDVESGEVQNRDGQVVKRVQANLITFARRAAGRVGISRAVHGKVQFR